MLKAACRPRTIDGSAYILTGALVAILAIFSVIIAVIFPSKINENVQNQINNFILLNSSSSLAYLAFSSSNNAEADVAVLDIYLFNCTNPDDVELGSTPTLVPIGPINLWVRHEIIDTSYDKTKNILSYKDYKYYIPWENDGDNFATGIPNTLTSQELQYKQKILQQQQQQQQTSTNNANLIITLDTKITSLYMPLVTLVAHGYGPSAFENIYNPITHKTDIIPNKINQILTGNCQNFLNHERLQQQQQYNNNNNLYTMDEYNCLLTSEEYVAATTLRTILHNNNIPDNNNNDDPSTNTLFVDRPIQEILFGYSDPIFEALNVLNSNFPKRYPGILGNTTSSMEAHRQNGYNRIYTGNNDITLTNNYIAWDSMDQLYCCAAGPCGNEGSKGSLAKPAWASTWANIVQGTRIDQFPPNIENTNTLRVFSDNFIRTMDLSYQPNIGNNNMNTIYNDIPTLRFGYDPLQFANVLNFPPNEAYYSTPSLPSGLLNTTTCSLGRVPLYYSKPYFYGGNQTLNNGAGLPLGQGITHDTWIDIEPLTGKSIASHYRHQMNVYVDSMPMPSITKTKMILNNKHRQLQGGSGGLFPSLSPVYFPLMWIDYNRETSNTWLNNFRNTIQIPLQTANTIKIITSVLGGLFGIMMIGFIIIGKQRYHIYNTQQLQLNIGSLLSTSSFSTTSSNTNTITKDYITPLLPTTSSSSSSHSSSFGSTIDIYSADTIENISNTNTKQDILLYNLDKELTTLLG